jgi:hypothetical protein
MHTNLVHGTITNDIHDLAELVVGQVLGELDGTCDVCEGSANLIERYL